MKTVIALRLPIELKEKLKELAIKKGISVNSLILTILWDSVKR